MRERGGNGSESDRDGIGTYNFIAKAKRYIDRSNLLRLFIEKIHKKAVKSFQHAGSLVSALQLHNARHIEQLPDQNADHQDRSDPADHDLKQALAVEREVLFHLVGHGFGADHPADQQTGEERHDRHEH